jgi:hypothetical protein
MARTFIGRQRRIAKLKARIASDDNDHFARCAILGCGRPTQRAAKRGLAPFLCRRCLRHRQRHGSPFCPSPSSQNLKPYQKAALALIARKPNDPFILAALEGLNELMRSAGEVVIAPRLRGPPLARAKVALARLREAEVEPARLLANCIAVYALIEDAPQLAHRISDWRLTGIGKSCHRLSRSGYYRTWETIGADGRTVRTEIRKHVVSTGRVLRHLGSLIEAACELVIDHFLAEIIAIKRTHDTQVLSGRAPGTEKTRGTFGI